MFYFNQMHFIRLLGINPTFTLVTGNWTNISNTTVLKIKKKHFLMKINERERVYFTFIAAGAIFITGIA